MPPVLFRPSSRPRFAWLLWLALLLPMAQAAAGWHQVSHARADIESNPDDPRLAHLQACDLCLTIAGVTAAAPGAEPAGFARLPLAHAVPVGLPAGVAFVAPIPAYLPRAPPIALR